MVEKAQYGTERETVVPVGLAMKLAKELDAARAALEAYSSAANTCPVFGKPGYQLIGWDRKRLDAAYHSFRSRT